MTSTMQAKTRILLTGGHMTPALAVLAEMQSRGYTDFVWVGHKYNQSGDTVPSAEFRSITEKGIPFIDLKAGKLSRNWGDGGWRAGVVNLLKIPWGFIAAFWIIVHRRPRLIMSFGGYLALPIVVWGRILGCKVLTHEQTVVTGLTNKILPYFAHKVLISWPSSAKYYPPTKTVLTGNPLRPEVFTMKSNKLSIESRLPVIYVTGGNQGSHKVNLALFAILPKLLEHAAVIHQTGSSSVTGDAQTAQTMKSTLPENLQKRYFPQAFFFDDEIGEVFAKTDLVIARSGANTTYELLALQKAAIFIPIPWVTHNEQHLNAVLAAETGMATILPEKDLNPRSLLVTAELAIKTLQSGVAFNGKTLEAAKQAAKAQIVPDAAHRIGEEIVKLLK